MTDPPFDAPKLDALMDRSGFDVLLVTSKHNARYLLGGHRALFFSYMDATGISRYLPVFVYVKGAPDRCAYFGSRSETSQLRNDPIWVGNAATRFSTSTDCVLAAVDHIRALGLDQARIGVEKAFLPLDSAEALQAALSQARLGDCLILLERLRAVKRPDEIAKLRTAADLIIDSMLAVIGGHGPGTMKRELVEALRREETDRGLEFEYCLIATGRSMNRAPSSEEWRAGEILSLDSGGNYEGYIGDLARMACHGPPDAELVDLLDQVELVQQAAIRAVKRGLPGGDLFSIAKAALSETSIAAHTRFLAHGMGMISHEAPRLTSSGPVPYPADDANAPLEANMVLSIETTLEHPRRGFIKLEDTVVVAENGFDVLGAGARGWTLGRA